MEDILETLVAFQTTSENHQANHEALDYIAHFLSIRGMHVTWFQSYGYESIIATTIAGQKQSTVMLAGHIDVVPAKENSFLLRRSEGKLYGRGVLDMKSPIASYLQLVDDLKERIEDFNFSIMITSDEEIGGQNGVKALLDEGYTANVCILPDGGDNWQIQTHAKGVLHLRITTSGKAAHGSRPWLGRSALDPLLAIISESQALFTVPSMDTNTLNVGKVSAGEASNQVPDHAEAIFDIRVIDEKSKASLLHSIQTICERHEAKLDILLDGPALTCNLTDPYVAPLVRIINETTGHVIHGSHTAGTNDGRYFAEHAIPCISFYPTGAGHHGPEEWIDSQALEQLRTILTAYITSIAI